MTDPAPPAPAADPLADPARVREIADLDLLSDETDPVLQAVVEEAARELGLSAATVSIVTEDAQFFAAHTGLSGWIAEARGTPVEWSFCQHVVRAAAPFVVEDAPADPRMAESPLVTHEGIRCYAGLPLVSSRGNVLGTLCAGGQEPRSFTPEEMSRLRALAARVVARMEERR